MSLSFYRDMGPFGIDMEWMWVVSPYLFLTYTNVNMDIFKYRTRYAYFLIKKKNGFGLILDTS